MLSAGAIDDLRSRKVNDRRHDRNLPVWRSALYVPANVPRFIDGAHRRGADAIIVDLEDSVPIAERPAARRDLIGDGRECRARRRRRASCASTGRGARRCCDLEAAICPRVTALAVTKVDSADHIRLVAEVVERARGRARHDGRQTKFIAMIETPDAWFHMPEIAKASRASSR